MKKQFFFRVSRNASDEKNLHRGGRKFIYFNRFSGDIFFSSIVPFAFLYSYFFACLYFKIKNICSDTLSTTWACE